MTKVKYVVILENVQVLNQAAFIIEYFDAFEAKFVWALKQEIFVRFFHWVQLDFLAYLLEISIILENYNFYH